MKRLDKLTSTVPEPHVAIQEPPENEIQFRIPPDGTMPTPTLGFSSTDMRKSYISVGAGRARPGCGR